MNPIEVIARMRDWLLFAGSDCNFLDYCAYTAKDVLSAIEDMYPSGVAGWVSDQMKEGIS